MKANCKYFVLASLVFLLTGVHAKSMPDDGLTQAENFFQQQNYTQAIQNWEKFLQNQNLTPTSKVDTQVKLATAYQAVGNYPSARAILQQALSLCENEKIPVEQQITVYSHLSDVLLATQRLEEAKTHLDTGLKLAQSLNNPLLLAHLLNNLGNIFSVQEDYGRALENYKKSAELANQQGNKVLYIQSLTNQVRVHVKQKNPQASFNVITTALTAIRENPDDMTKSFQLISLGQTILSVQQRFQRWSLFSETYQTLDTALKLAERYQNKRLQAYAKGYLGQLYEQARRYPDALQLTNEAIFLAQEAPDILYLWEWQQGRIFLAQQDLTSATAAFKRSLMYLQPIRNTLTVGQRDVKEIFQERIHPVYFGLADILLQRAMTSDNSDAKQMLLIEARNTIELLKVAELQNYFQDSCVTPVEVKKLDHLDKQTAVLYPILLPNRTELLLTLPDGIIYQVVIPIEAATLTDMIVTFQKNLQTRATWNFFRQATQLYRWLIAPLEDKLTGEIDTLVIIPDGPLRMIPMAALHDGKQFLVERFAIATTPGLDLTEPRPLVKDKMVALLQGLSVGVQNFSPLPEVPREINDIREILEQNKVLLDKDFTLDHVSQALQKVPYSIIHIASHGQFNQDPKKTFLLAYDDKITMNRLERLLSFSQLRKEPVELLTLSACQTAVGDERAALGLAGVAIKAGARSALASLWFVNDEATSYLITEFYRQLKQDSVSRAKALQNAQKALIAHRELRHPAYWAPFLLIGNWL